MKKIKRILQLSLSLLFFNAVNAQPISPYVFGQNAWMPDTIGSKYYGGKLHQQWTNIQASKVSVVRFGGIGADKNRPTNYQYIKMIDAIRAHGMEPTIQVPYNKGQFTAQEAADIVKFINITSGKNIKYWSIGNEPDLGYAYTTAAQIAAYIKPFASAMKAVDPTILISGPECAWFNQGIIDGLTTPNGPYDITGTDGNGRYYVDMIAFHCYGFDGTQTRAQVISKLTSANSLQANLIYLNNRLTACNAAHGRNGASVLKTGVTEANIDWQNATNDDLYGVGANSFVGGQFIAEMMGIGMKNGLTMLNLWSVIEGNATPLNIGYLDNLNNNKKPAYYHFQMVAANFKGNNVNCTSNVTNVKSFASQNSEGICVLVMNQDLTTNYNFTVRLNTSTITGNNPLKINVNAGVAVEHSDVLPNQSSRLLVFNPQGILIKQIDYSLMTHAVANLAPTEKIFSIPTAVVSNESGDGEIANLKGFTINLFPNPANSKFTIQLDRNNPQQREFDIEIYDLMGRLIYNRKTEFHERKQEIDLSGNSLAEAVYIVKVDEHDDKDNTQSKKVVLFK
jgi:hypothetical protein